MTDKPSPNPAIKSLERYVGTWRVTGATITGQIRYEWMEGGFFMLQHVDLVHDGNVIKGIEYIRYDPESGQLKSNYFDNNGTYFEYVYEIGDDTMTIWGGYIGSPAVYRGKDSADGSSHTGAWEYPGGGYDSTMTKTGA